MAYTSSQVVQAVPTGINSALVYIGGSTLSGASITFSNVFSATYDVYLVVINNAKGDGAPIIKATIGAITTNYKAALTINNTAPSYSAAQAFWNFGYCGYDVSPADQVVSYITITNPFLSVRKMAWGVHLFPPNLYYDIFGSNSETTSCTSLTLTATSNTFLDGTVKIYGYQNS